MRKGKSNPNYKGGHWMKQYYCKQCSAKISLNNGIYGSNLCMSCSRKGKNHVNYGKQLPLEIRNKISLTLKGRYTGNLSPHWRGGKSFEPYPLGWTNTFKEQIRYRDRYKCQLCGKPEIENCRKLDVHHIDYDKNNLEISNLISLCNSCHTKTNTNRKYWKEYYTKLMEVNYGINNCS